MRILPLVAVLVVLAGSSPGFVQADLPPTPEEMAARLSFEAGSAGGLPRGWVGRPPGTVFLDEVIVHAGRGSARLERTASSESPFTPLIFSIPATFSGATLELKAFLRTEDVVGNAALWLREDGVSGSVAFDNMRGRQLQGTTPWAPYSISLPLKAEARQIAFGALLGGTGKAWIDDVELLVDGKPVWLAPRVERVQTILERDHEFDTGSKLSLSTLTPGQVENLAILGQVWGFLKYHHPAATKGVRHWDYELFRVMPRVLSAADGAAALAVMDGWVAGLGPVASCNPCAIFDQKAAHLQPDLAWIADAKRLGSSLVGRLRAIHANRSPAGEQFYVSLVPGLGNPSFAHEPAYPNAPAPDPGFQVLALFRWWNIVQYWFPYRDVIGESWEGVLRKFLPRLALAKRREAYELELMALIGSIHDTHANLGGSLAVRPPVGSCQAPAVIRFIEGSAVVAGLNDGAPGVAGGLRLGDVILEVDGVTVPTLLDRWRPYYAASNEATRLRDMARAFTRGACGEAAFRVRREGATLSIGVPRLLGVEPRGLAHDVPGDTFRRLSDRVGYLKLSRVRAADAARYVESAKGADGLIIDIRNYPSEFVVFALGSLLVDSDTPFARFTTGDLVNPGAFNWGESVKLEPARPHYAGKVVLLVDETTQSSAEYTAMAFRASPRTVVIGSTTAGADGNVSSMALPFGLSTMISGLGVFYPDRRPTQRVGIVPDVEVRPTIAGIRAGRDEVLEEALRHLLGASASRAEIEALVRAAWGR